MSINKVVITAAGLGTRLLSATKEMPKEMLPLFSINSINELTIKPVLQLIFEQLFDMELRKFCFVVGRGKRSVEDHFTPDYHFIELLKKTGKASKAVEL
jgi:UTP--glucose-1-phosphate uridylyltransferase